LGLLITDIFKMGILKDAEIVAGKSGLYNEIVWINMMEILDVLDSLQQGELLITTGYGLDNREKYGEIIFKLKEIGLAGIGIQPGYYLEDIPGYIIETADQCGFPVIRIPRKITFSHITRTIYQELLRMEEHKDVNKGENNNVILDLLEGKPVEKESERYLLDIISKEEQKRTYIGVFGISHKEDGIIVRSDIDASIKKMQDTLVSSQCKVHCEGIRGSSVLMFSVPDTSFPNVYTELEIAVDDLSKSYPKLTFTLGISLSLQSIDQIVGCYYQALSIQQTLEKIKVAKGVCRYEEAGVLKVVENFYSKGNLIGFMKDALKELLVQDEVNKTNYIQTLKCYLQNNCNANYSAQSLMVHRHTLRYRLGKIEKLCDIDFQSFKSRLKYMLAIMIYDLYSG